MGNFITLWLLNGIPLSLSWPSLIQNLIEDLQKWNKEVFGNILTKKKRLIHKLEKLSNQTKSGEMLLFRKSWMVVGENTSKRW